MKSVISLMAAKKVEQHGQWSSRGHNFDDSDLERWASATIMNAYNSIDTVRFCYSYVHKNIFFCNFFTMCRLRVH